MRQTTTCASRSAVLGISESEKVKVAVKSLGLDDLAPFDARKRVIEYLLEDGAGTMRPLGVHDVDGLCRRDLQ